MNYGKIYYCDVANGEGCRTSLFVSGCTHHCVECFNPQTWDFAYGEPFTTEIENKIIESLKPEYISGLTVLGGEPMEIRNQAVIRPFLQRVRKEVDHGNIWLYSGYTWEELTDRENERCYCPDTEDILNNIDVLVDGRFIIEKKDLTLPFRGSSNQRIIDVGKTLKENRIVLYEVQDNRSVF
ncbi:MAG: anaerobic ribonucleoside-triphosphate reductase activating protein [Lachnospiraceae bacterium]|nr:anaerobic ribonucleoside-triphosphate reductase activating protein [Lachnospiraceae bacterium]